MDSGLTVKGFLSLLKSPFLRVGNVRASKVSMRANCASLLACSCAVMRTRSRPSGYAVRLRVGAEHRLHEKSCAVMRTRSRPSGYAVRLRVGTEHRLHEKSCAVMRTRPRPSGCAARVHNVRWTLVLDRPKRSVDGGDCVAAPTRRSTTPSIFSLKMRNFVNISCVFTKVRYNSIERKCIL